MRLHSIEIGFENGDTCIINEYDIDYMVLNDVQTNLVFDHIINNLSKEYTIGEVHLVIAKNADKEFKEFGIDEFKTTVFERLQYRKDINRIIVRYSQNIHATYFIRSHSMQIAYIENNKLHLDIEGGYTNDNARNRSGSTEQRSANQIK